jgi:hypothetical protein
MKAINAMANNQRMSVVLPIGSTSEYNDVMVTALTTRDDVVRDHPELVRGLLRAIQRASIIVKCGFEYLINYAAERFNQARDQVALALDAANKAMVFPVNLAVGRPQWENACDAYLASLDTNANAKRRAKIQKLFADSVEPHTLFAHEAMRQEFSALEAPSVQPPTNPILKWLKDNLAHPYAAGVGILIGAFAGLTIDLSTLLGENVVFLFSCIAMAVAAIVARQYQHWSRGRALLYYVLCASLVPWTWVLIYSSSDLWRGGAISVMASVVAGLVILFLTKEKQSE